MSAWWLVPAVVAAYSVGVLHECARRNRKR